MSRVWSLDYLKLLLALGVVIGHSGLLHQIGTTGAFMFGNGLLRVIVPLFAMVSGWLFHGVMARGRVPQWFARIGGFYLAATLLYLPFWITPATSLRTVAGVLVWGYFHLWFLAGLLVAAAMLVAMRFLGLGRSGLLLAAGLLVSVALAGQWAVFAGADLPVHRYINGFTVVFPFMVIGYLIAASDRPPLPMGYLLALLVLGLALLMAEAWLVRQHFGLYVMDELPVSVLLVAPVAFLIALQLRLPPPRLSRPGQPERFLPIGFIAAAIYLLHVLAGMMVWRLFDGGPLASLMAGVLLPAAGALWLWSVSGRSRKTPRESEGCAARHS